MVFFYSNLILLKALTVKFNLFICMISLIILLYLVSSFILFKYHLIFNHLKTIIHQNTHHHLKNYSIHLHPQHDKVILFAILEASIVCSFLLYNIYLYTYFNKLNIYIIIP